MPSRHRERASGLIIDALIERRAQRSGSRPNLEVSSAEASARAESVRRLVDLLAPSARVGGSGLSITCRPPKAPHPQLAPKSTGRRR
jgi:hypothetical protein